MRFASVAEVKNQLSRYLAQARKTSEPIIVTHHGKPYALIQSITEKDLEELGWKTLRPNPPGGSLGRRGRCPL